MRLVKDRLDQIELFYSGVAAAARAVSRCNDLRVAHGRPMHLAAPTLRLPLLTINPSVVDVARYRGATDAVAFRERFGGDQPASDVPFLQEMEQIRVEALGCRVLSGARYNLACFYDRQTPGDPPSNRLPLSKVSVVCRMIREALVLRIAGSAGATLTTPERRFVERQYVLLDETLDDVQRYVSLANAIGRELGLITSPLQVVLPDGVSKAEPEDSGDVPVGGEVPSETEERGTRSAPRPTAAVAVQPQSAAARAYRRYDEKFDQIVVAQDLAPAKELAALRAALDAMIRTERFNLARLAGRLTRHLLSAVDLAWDQDLDEGLLNDERLDQLVVNPVYPLMYRRRRPVTDKDVVVTLLVDNSGSMRGRPIAVAAMCADMLARTLERCGIRSEVLGYTTRFWRGGAVRNQWVDAGKPVTPGRLNGLRHIVYKPAELPWRRARSGLALMLKEDLLKENIDGEALSWAAGRLLEHRARRKILIVVSDGAPSDQATEDANGPDYLAAHLSEVVAHLTRAARLELYAIGVGYDVTRIYPHAVAIDTEEKLGDELVAELVRLFDVAAGGPRPLRAYRGLPRA